MITELKSPPRSSDSSEQVNESDVREYAYHLYAQGGYAPDHDVDNWLEAKACLSASIPRSESNIRLHQHTAGKLQLGAPASRARVA
jgi:hypothetical protein